MSKLYVTEYMDMGVAAGFIPIAKEPALVEQAPIAISGTHAESAAFGPNTRFIRVHTDVICSIVFGDAPVATTSHKRLAANQTEYFGVAPQQKLSVIANT